MLDSLLSAYEFLAKGGVVMIFIFICSMVAIAFFIERCIFFRHEVRRTNRLMVPLLESIRLGQFERAYSLCDDNGSCMSSIARCALGHKTVVRDALLSAVADEGRRSEVKLNRRIPAIGAISTLSPLLGLLGTVTGMITIFSQMADEYAAGMTANQGMLAGGIWEALLTTAAGLCVAIPAFVMHRYLCAKLDNFQLDLEAYATQIVDLLSPPPLAETCESGRQIPAPLSAVDSSSAEIAQPEKNIQAVVPPEDEKSDVVVKG